MESETQNSPDDIDWENRILCSDGNCIGVVGPDGCCKECGLRYPGDLPAALSANQTAEATAPAETAAHFAETAATEPQEAQSDSISAEEWENRRLCPDGNCIGVIGQDGKCKECGRPAES